MKMKKTIKTKLRIGLLSALIGIIYMNWTLDDGPSCFDPLGGTGTFGVVLTFVPIQFLATFIILLLFRVKVAYYLTVVSLSIFWFLLHLYYLIYFKACWSTYLNYEFFPEIIYTARYPLMICLSLFTLGYFYLTRGSVAYKEKSSLYFHLCMGFLLIGIIFFFGIPFIDFINDICYPDKSISGHRDKSCLLFWPSD